MKVRAERKIVSEEAIISSRELSKGSNIEARWCYLMLIFPMIGFLVLKVYPIFWTFRWSFFSYDQVPSNTRFIGLENFKTLFLSDHTYWKTWITTFQFALYKIPIEITLALTIALVLSRDIKGSNFFRTMYYLPNVISVAIVGIMFSNMFSFFGLINAILIKFGLITEGIDWFASKLTAMTVLVIGSIWNTFGINVLYFVAALSNVPKELYECATLDGASARVRFFKITLPSILPVAQIILLLSIVGTLSVNDYILALTAGGPAGTTSSVMSYLTLKFVPGFAEAANPPIGYGCALSLVTTILFAVVALLYNLASKKINS